MIRILKPSLLFIIFFYSSIALSQEDGLETNSFDQSAESAENQPLNPALSNTIDQGYENLEGELYSSDNTTNGEIDTQDTEGDAQSPNQPLFSETPGVFDLGADQESNDLERQGYFPRFIYEDRGRKNPFEPSIQIGSFESAEDGNGSEEETLREGLLKFEVGALKVSAILISRDGKPKALLRDPSGVVYTIKENDKVGRNNGIVKRIRQGQIVIVEYRDQKDGERLYTTQVLGLGK